MQAPDSSNPPRIAHLIYVPDNWVIFRLRGCSQPMCLYSSQEIIVSADGVHLSPSRISIAWDGSAVAACWIVLMDSTCSGRDAIEVTSLSEYDPRLQEI